MNIIDGDSRATIITLGLGVYSRSHTHTRNKENEYEKKTSQQTGKRKKEINVV